MSNDVNTIDLTIVEKLKHMYMRSVALNKDLSNNVNIIALTTTLYGKFSLVLSGLESIFSWSYFRCTP